MSPLGRICTIFIIFMLAGWPIDAISMVAGTWHVSFRIILVLVKICFCKNKICRIMSKPANTFAELIQFSFRFSSVQCTFPKLMFIFLADLVLVSPLI